MSERIHVQARDLVPRTLRFCAAVIALLVLADIVFNWLDVGDDTSIRRIWNVAREESVPTWWASTQALATGVGAGLVYWLNQRRGQVVERGWLFVAGFFTYIAVDDAAKIHERVGSFLGRVSEDTALLGWLVEANPSFSWQVFVAPVLALCLLASLGFLWLRGGNRTLIVLAAAGFGFSQGLDFIEGIDGLFDSWAEDLDVDDYTVSHAFKLVEETLEMLATLACLGTVVGALEGALRGVTVDFEG